MSQAVFLDRDGVINELIYNGATGEYESPHVPEDLIIFPYVISCLERLKEDGYLLFLISNQPSYAKGKTTLENIKKIEARLSQFMVQAGIFFTEYYYCYHHPQGIVPEYTCVCQCRKPGNYFLLQAEKNYGLDLKQSWLIGDQDSDIFCGQASGMKTVLLNQPLSQSKRGKSRPDYYAADLVEATEWIHSYGKGGNRDVR